MKKFAITVLLLGTLFALQAAQVNVSFRPARPEAGTAVRVTVSASTDNRNGAELILPALPRTARWNYNMRSDGTRMSMTGSGQPQVTHTFVRQLTVTAPGKLEIPPFKVRSASGEIQSDPVILEVLPAGSRPQTGEKQLKPFGKLFTTPSRPLRPGEKINLHLELYIPENYELLNISNPDFNGFGNAVLQKDPRTGNMFRQYNTVVRSENGHEYTVWPFSAAALTTLSGEFFPEMGITLTVRERRQVSRDDFGDDIFNSFFGSRNSYGRPENIRIQFKDTKGFKVVPLPPLPEGAIDTGLTGSWNCSARFSTASCRSGEVAELEILLVPRNLSGNIDEVPLKVPALQFPGFRVYPPETIRKNNRISIRYALIPLSPGEKKLHLKLAVFDTVKNMWQTEEISPELVVTPGSVDQNAQLPAPTAVQTPEKTVKNITPEAETVVSDGLHYLKVDNSDRLKLPLIANQKFILFLTFGGGILLLIVDWLCRKFYKPGSGAERQHRKELQRKIAVLCRELENSSDPAGIVEKYGLAEIAELSGLAAGATAQDIADRVGDPELKEFFSNIAQSSFAPGANRQNNSPGVRKKLLKYLKHLAVFLLLCSIPALYGKNFTAANEAYDQGNYQLAAEEYRRALSGEGVSVPLFYNLGCTEFKLGNYPEARVWFSRAGLLAPGDLEIQANLKLTEEKLQLDAAENSSSFTAHLTALRDSLFRPDQYFALASICFFILCLIVVLRKYGSSALRWSCAAVVLFAMVLALLAAWNQMENSYSPDRIILVGKTVEIRSLPVENSGDVLKKVASGGSAVLIEKRGSWLRIVCDDTEGWIHETQAVQVFPYGIL